MRAQGPWRFDWEGYHCERCGVIVEHHTNNELIVCLWAVRGAADPAPPRVSEETRS